MRVECSTLDDFLVNLGSVDNPASSVFGGVVYADTLRDQVGTGSNAYKYAVTFQASAVIRVEDGGEYLLVVGVRCGNDYVDASNGREGTDAASSLKLKLMDFCNGRCLTVRPGRVSE